jgi:hypothetical protein
MRDVEEHERREHPYEQQGDSWGEPRKQRQQTAHPKSPIRGPQAGKLAESYLLDGDAPNLPGDRTPPGTGDTRLPTDAKVQVASGHRGVHDGADRQAVSESPVSDREAQTNVEVDGMNDIRETGSIDWFLIEAHSKEPAPRSWRARPRP